MRLGGIGVTPGELAQGADGIVVHAGGNLGTAEQQGGGRELRRDGVGLAGECERPPGVATAQLVAGENQARLKRARVLFTGALEQGDALPGASLLAGHAGQGHQGDRLMRVALEHTLVGRAGLVAFSLAQIHAREVERGGGVVGIELHRLAVALPGHRVVVAALVGGSQQVLQPRAGGVFLREAAGSGDRLVEGAILQMRHDQQCIAAREVGIAPHGPLQLGDGVAGVAGRQVADRELGADGGIVGRQRCRLVELDVNGGEQLARLVVRGQLLEVALEEHAGLFELAPHEVPATRLEQALGFCGCDARGAKLGAMRIRRRKAEIARVFQLLVPARRVAEVDVGAPQQPARFRVARIDLQNALELTERGSHVTAGSVIPRPRQVFAQRLAVVRAAREHEQRQSECDVRASPDGCRHSLENAAGVTCGIVNDPPGFPITGLPLLDATRQTPNVAATWIS